MRWVFLAKDITYISLGPHSDILMTGGGGGEGEQQKFIFYTSKNPSFGICLLRKIHRFFSLPPKIPSFFSIIIQKISTLAVNCTYVIVDQS